MPLPLPTHKVCEKHGELTEELRYYYKTRIGNTTFRCRPCMNAQSKLFKKVNPEYYKQPHVIEKHKAANKIWVANNRDKVYEKNKRHYHKSKEWYHANKHTEHYKEMKRAAYHRNINARREHYNMMSLLKANRYSRDLSNIYLNKIIKMRGLSDLPNQDDLRQYIKSILLMKRKIRELK